MSPKVFLVFLFFRSFSCADGIDLNINLSEKNNTELYSNQSATTDIPLLVPNVDEKKSEIFDRILGKNYDKSVRPSAVEGIGPTVVSVAINIDNLENIDDTKNEYSIQMFLNQEWIDPRLSFAHLAADIDHFYLQEDDKVWTPDLYFPNEKKGLRHDILSPNQYTRIYRDGLVSQVYRITILSSCIFNLRSFPFDVQSCPISVQSFGWTTKDLIIQWSKKIEPVTLDDEFEIARFKLTNYSTETRLQHDFSGEYSTIFLNIRFERELGYYLAQIYIPCAMLVIVSWVSFWLEPEAIEARVSIGVTTILTTVTQTYGINQSAPPASYVKALDVWTAFCQAMVFGVLLQFSLVNFISRNETSEVTNNPDVGKASTQMLYDSPIHTVKVHPLEVLLKPKVLEAKIKAKKFSKAKRIDIAARVIFPCTFIVFNIIYWATYL